MISTCFDRMARASDRSAKSSVGSRFFFVGSQRVPRKLDGK
jgi:hypothetical protein